MRPFDPKLMAWPVDLYKVETHDTLITAIPYAKFPRMTDGVRLGRINWSQPGDSAVAGRPLSASRPSRSHLRGRTQRRNVRK